MQRRRGIQHTCKLLCCRSIVAVGKLNDNVQNGSMAFNRRCDHWQLSDEQRNICCAENNEFHEAYAANVLQRRIQRPDRTVKQAAFVANVPSYCAVRQQMALFGIIAHFYRN